MTPPPEALNTLSLWFTLAYYDLTPSPPDPGPLEAALLDLGADGQEALGQTEIDRMRGQGVRSVLGTALARVAPKDLLQRALEHLEAAAPATQEAATLLRTLAAELEQQAAVPDADVPSQSLWFTLAFLYLSTADGKLDPAESIAWRVGRERLGLEDAIETHSLKTLARMSGGGTREMLARAMRELPPERRVALLRSIWAIIDADGKTQPAEIEAFEVLCAELGIELSDVRANLEAYPPQLIEPEPPAPTQRPRTRPLSVIDQHVRAFQNGSESRLSLLRVLIDHEGWILPATLSSISGPTPELLRTPDGPRLVAFSDDEHLAAFAEAVGGEPGMCITVTGRSLFDEMIARITGVDLNPRSRFSMSFEARHFEVIQQTAQGMILDDILHGRTVRPDRYTRLRRFAGYRLPSRVTNGVNQMMLAPDPAGRRLAPVFTTKDAAEAFAHQVLEREGAPPAMGRYDGKTLFKHLASASLDGILFNPAGPGTPRQMPADFARLVLERDTGE